MTDMDTKQATSKFIRTALVCQLCWISCQNYFTAHSPRWNQWNPSSNHHHSVDIACSKANNNTTQRSVRSGAVFNNRFIENLLLSVSMK